MLDRRHLLALSAASVLAPTLASRAALAQSWPSRVVRLVVPYSAGGPTDIVARLIAERLSNIWGRQVVIENRGGAGSNLGAEAVARSSADGYTALIGASAIALNPSLYRSVGYDPVADFAPVTQICSFPFFMFVPNASAARSVGDFIALAKQNRGKLTYGSAGVGSAQHLCVEMFQRSAGIELIHVPYRGASDGLNDLIPGRIDLYFSSGALLEQMRACGERRQTRPGGAGPTDRRRGRRPRLRRDRLVRHLRPGQDAAGDRQAHACRHRRGAGRARHQDETRTAWLYGGRLHPRGAGTPPPCRDRQMGCAHQGGRHLRQ
jgi:Tripartite tricarboxylate transporter family receptor